MPAKYDSATIVCGSCQKKAVYRVCVKVSGDDYPELKAQVLDGSLFAVQCQQCHGTFHLAYPFRYSDYSKHFFAFLCPKEQMQENYGIIQMMPSLRANGTRVHVAQTVEELQRLITSYDLGLSPPETHIDQSVDAAREAEALFQVIDASFARLDQRALQAQAAAEKAKKRPWYKRLFG